MSEYKSLLHKTELFGPFYSGYKLSKFRPNGYRIASSDEILKIREAKKALGYTNVDNVAFDIKTISHGCGRYGLSFKTFKIDEVTRLNEKARVTAKTVITVLNSGSYYISSDGSISDLDFEQPYYIYCIKL